MCISVDLPEPDGPMIAVSSPAAHVERDAAERVDRRVALAVAARQVVRCDSDGGLRRASAQESRFGSGLRSRDASLVVVAFVPARGR